MYEDEDEELYQSMIKQWRLLKLDPKFDTERQRGRYMIVSRLPGMREEDISIQINERDHTLTISGFRLPSRDEFEEIKANFTRRFRFSSSNDFAKQLFRFGVRRYGSFSSAFSLPDNAITKKIDAKYDNGILYVSIPFRAPKPTVPQYAPKHPYNPYYAPRGYNPRYKPKNNFDPFANELYSQPFFY